MNNMKHPSEHVLPVDIYFIDSVRQSDRDKTARWRESTIRWCSLALAKLIASKPSEAIASMFS